MGKADGEILRVVWKRFICKNVQSMRDRSGDSGRELKMFGAEFHFHL